MSSMSFSVIVVMGVSGAGKSTIASMLALRLGWTYEDADWFHPPANIEKMHSGQPLTDDDRWPWLEAVAAWIDETRGAGRHGVIACSALKRAYRDEMLSGRPAAVMIFLQVSRDVLARRLAARHGHFFPEKLLDSQLETLELPAPDEHVLTVVVDGDAGQTAARIIAILPPPGRPGQPGPRGA